MSPENPLAIRNVSGIVIDAHFSVEVLHGQLTLVIESKGGGVNSESRRNQDYDLGLKLLLERLAILNATILDAVVDSQVTQKAGLSHEHRRLLMRGSYNFPITLNSIDDFEDLRKALCAGQKPIGQQPGSKGGNGQKRVRLYLDLGLDDNPGEGVADVYAFGRQLANPDESAVISDVDVANAADAADQNGAFDPSSVEDARSRLLAAIVQRQGQPGFRNQLLNAYGGRCAITGCSLEDVLEAAHIHPYQGMSTNAVSNGLLLRSDIHTLFDRKLIVIDTGSWTVIVDTKLLLTQYSTLSGQSLNLPVDPRLRPSIAALNFHRSLSGM